MRSHSVTCHPAEVIFLHLPQPKLVLDLATPEGCKAELTWVVVIYPKIVYPRNTVTYLRNNQAVSWQEFEHATVNTNLAPISRFRVIAFDRSKIAIFGYPSSV